MIINFFVDECCVKPSFPEEKTAQWLECVALHHGYKLAEINYLFTNDEGILAANQNYLGHDYYTDIITFDSRTPQDGEDELRGDILIGYETVESNAKRYGVPYAHELRRVLVHGILHLVGINDITEEEEQAMRRAEEEALIMWDDLFANPDLFPQDNKA